MRNLALILALLIATPVFAQTISLPSKYPGWTVLAGSQRHINATVGTCTTCQVNWSVTSTGGASATLSATTNTNPWVDITFGSTSGTCSVTGTIGSYGISDTATVTLTAQSVENTGATASVVFYVCSGTVQVETIPFYRVLYAGQKAEIQSRIVGSTNEQVTWAITGQPAGGDGSLSDTGNMDTVFSATVAGRYTITATSVADGTKTNFTTIDVTGNAMPYQVTPNLTEPVDCTADPTETGEVLDVGPSQTYTSITAAINYLYGLSPSDWHGYTIRVHNEDLTGSSPTTYHEYFQVRGSATRTQPIRICGVPDSSGHLPVLDAANATGPSWESTAGCMVAGSTGSAICIWPSGAYGFYAPGPIPVSYVVIEGLAIKNANQANTYTPPGGGAAVSYSDGMCLSLKAGSDDVFVGNDISGCNIGVFEDFQDSHAWYGFAGHTLIEGNHIHGNGYTGSSTDHQLYLQGWLAVVQFNRIDQIVAGSKGSNFKDRGVGTIVRYNYFGDGATGNSPLRVLDAVDDTDSAGYFTLDAGSESSGYAYMGYSGNTNCGVSWYCSGDTLGISGVTAWNEMWHHYYIYGNVVQNSIANWFLHFLSDKGAGDRSRQGTAYVYDNTIALSTGNGYGVFDPDDNAGGTPTEYPQFYAQNNVIWSNAANACWNRIPSFNATYVTNVVSTGPLDAITPPLSSTFACNTDSGWQGSGANITNFTLSAPLNTHITGLDETDFISSASQPYNSSTYSPVTPQNGTALSGAIANLPVRFQYLPSSSTVVARTTPVTSSAGGTVGGVDYAPVVLNSNSAPQMLLLQ